MISDSSDFSVSGQIADVVSGKIFPGRITVSKGRITAVEHFPEAENQYIIPGLIDAHVHIEIGRAHV